jgi:hypothetical protein
MNFCNKLECFVKHTAVKSVIPLAPLEIHIEDNFYHISKLLGAVVRLVSLRLFL